MNTLSSYVPDGLVESLGWTLLHSLWQGLLLLAIATFFIWVLRIRSASIRYHIMVSSLGVFSLMVIGTFVLLLDSGPALVVDNLFDDLPVSLVAERNTSGIMDQSFVSVLATNIHWFVATWFVGMTFFMLRIGGGFLYLNRLKAKSRSSLPDGLQSLFDGIKETLNIEQDLTLRISDFIDVPMVMGVVKPMVLIPTSLITGLSEDQLKAILVHELAHIKRYDYVVNFIQTAIEAIFFFNPFVWVMSSYIRQEREHCCDDVAVSMSGDAINYVSALARVEEIRTVPSNMGLALAKNKSELYHRIQRIINGPSGYQIDFKGMIVILSVVSLSILSAFAYTTENDASITEKEKLREGMQSLQASLDGSSVYADELSSGEVIPLLIPLDTTKEELWKTVFLEKIKHNFSKFYKKNKEQIDKMVAEMKISDTKKTSLTELMKKNWEKAVVEEDRMKAELLAQLQEANAYQVELGNQFKKLTEKNAERKAKMEMHVQAKRLEIEREIQRMKEIANNNGQDPSQRLEKLQEMAMKFKLEEMQASELIKAQLLELEKSKSNLQKRQKEIELKYHQLQLNQVRNQRNKQKNQLFMNELVDNMIKDGYMDKDDKIKTVDFKGTHTYMVDGKPIRKKHREKYIKLVGKYLDQSIEGIVVTVK